MSNETETPPSETTEPAAPAPEWRYKKEFRLVGQMRDVIQKTAEVTELEIKSLHRKLEKLTYGS